MQHSFGADVFVDVRPVNTVTVADQDPVPSLLGSGVGQTPGPLKRHTDDPSVDELSGDRFVGDLDFPDAGVSQDCSVHPMLQGFAPRVR